MRQVVGNSTRDLDAAGLAQLRGGYQRLVLDVGTGDGKHVLALARQQPASLVIGLDAAPDAMRKAAGRKAAPPNAVFVWAAVEQLPGELADVDEVHALMPWGSLLRAFVTPDEAVLAGLAGRCRPGARFLVTLNLHAWRPPVPEVGGTAEPTPESVVQTLAPAYARAGWQLESADYLDAAQLAALGTSWTKRLGSSRSTLAVLALRGTLHPPQAP